MKRHRIFDPPEYRDWKPDPEIMREFEETLATPERAPLVAELSETGLLAFYRDLLTTRLQDIGLKRWVRQGVISKAWLCTGEEAVTVGNVRALDPGSDIVSPMIRNAGACHMMGMAVADVFRGYLATEDGPNGGRDLHVGALDKGVVQPISHMGTSVPVMAGVALAFRNRRQPGVALTWVGDGATKTGECHEGLNFAAVQRLPAIFVIQNNQVALGTPLAQHSAGALERWPELYGVSGWSCDGNNVLDVYAATRMAADACRNGDGPALVVASTFRMGGHATHDEREARETFSPALFAHWGRRDPVGLYETWLERQGIAREVLEDIESEVSRVVRRAAEEALASRSRQPSPEQALYRGISQGGTLVSLELRPF